MNGAKNWFVKMEGKPIGPYSEEELVLALQTQEITPKDEAYSPFLQKNWDKIENIALFSTACNTLVNFELKAPDLSLLKNIPATTNSFRTKKSELNNTAAKEKATVSKVPQRPGNLEKSFLENSDLHEASEWTQQLNAGAKRKASVLYIFAFLLLICLAVIFLTMGLKFFDTKKTRDLKDTTLSDPPSLTQQTQETSDPISLPKPPTRPQRSTP